MTGEHVYKPLAIPTCSSIMCHGGMAFFLPRSFVSIDCKTHKAYRINLCITRNPFSEKKSSGIAVLKVDNPCMTIDTIFIGCVAEFSVMCKMIVLHFKLKP